MSKYRDIVITDPVTKEEKTYYIDLDDIKDREQLEKSLAWAVIDGFSNYGRDYEEEDIKQVAGPNPDDEEIKRLGHA